MVLGLAASWLIFSTWWSLPWFLDLGRQLGSVAALILIALIALIPGFFNSFLLFGLMFDRRPRSSRLASYPSISILIAAYNEEKDTIFDYREYFSFSLSRRDRGAPDK